MIDIFYVVLVVLFWFWFGYFIRGWEVSFLEEQMAIIESFYKQLCTDYDKLRDKEQARLAAHREACKRFREKNSSEITNN